jgi:transposase
MKPFLFVRDLTEEEKRALEDALGSERAFTRRRARILRFSAQGLHSGQIAEGLGCTRQTVRNGIHAFHKQGLASLTPEPQGPRDPDRLLEEQDREELQAIVHQSPRTFEKSRSTWTLPLLAEVAFEEELTPRRVSGETIRKAIHALGSSWQRAKTWIESPDLQYALKKSRETV